MATVARGIDAFGNFRKTLLATPLNEIDFNARIGASRNFSAAPGLSFITGRET